MNASHPAPAQGENVIAAQVAALCWRMHDAILEVLLITSRETGRWVIPKGWPIAGLTAAEAAAREAWEEAGARGTMKEHPLGEYIYDKVLGPSKAKRCNVAVFGMQVDTLDRRFPEANQRQRSWFPAGEAAGLVAEPDLQSLFRFIAEDPDRLIGARSAPLA